MDEFEFEEGVDVGDIREVFIRHDDSALFGSDDWFLESVTIQHHVAGKAWKFTCKDWLRKTKDLKPEKLLSDAVAVDMSGKELLSPQLLGAAASGSVDVQAGSVALPHAIADSVYIVRVVTGDESDAGTNANVFLEMFFENGVLPIQKLERSDHLDKFERGQTDSFEILVPESLQGLNSIAISSDDSGFGSKWLLSHVEVELCGKGLRTVFPCGQWLQKTRLILAPGDRRDVAQADGVPAASKQPEVFRYTVLVETGDVMKAGTDANVMITIIGSKCKLEEKKLSSSKTFTDKFERVGRAAAG